MHFLPIFWHQKIPKPTCKLVIFGTKFCTKNVWVKRWWNWRQVTSIMTLKGYSLVIRLHFYFNYKLIFIFFSCKSKKFSILAFAPPVSDCSELYRLGYRLSGVYVIDPSGSRDVSKSVEVYCQDGWTYLLRRGLEINVR